ncbi:1-Cys peroxiredoxin [Linum grandiflorum]
MPGLTIGDTLPNLEVESTHGVIKLHDFVTNSWTILFSHPGDFTPVCTTELGKMAAYAPEFEKKGVKLLGLSCDDVLSHVEWINFPNLQPGSKVTYPIISDPKREVSNKLVIINLMHAVWLIFNLMNLWDDAQIKLSFLYPASTGRNMEEVMRVVESLQRASKHKIATPADWKPGDAVVISPSVSNEEADKMFPQGYKTADLPSNKGYLRFTHVD